MVVVGFCLDELLLLMVLVGVLVVCVVLLLVGSCGECVGGWWGVFMLIVIEVGLFGYLLFCYFYL